MTNLSYERRYMSANIRQEMMAIVLLRGEGRVNKSPPNRRYQIKNSFNDPQHMSNDSI